MLAVSLRPAKGVPLTFEGLRIKAGEKGFDHPAESYTAMQKEKPDFAVGETAMTLWATSLGDTGHLAEAIEVLKLEVRE